MTFQIGHHENASVRQVIRQTEQDIRDPQLIANRLAWRLRTRINRGWASLDEAVNDVVEFCRRNSKNKLEKKLVVEVLLQLIYIVAEYEYCRKETVRTMLLLLHDASPNDHLVVYREIYFFEYAKTVVPLGERKDLHRKMFYMMKVVAGWKFPKYLSTQSTTQYIDLPLSPSVPFADNSLLSEAVYRLQDEEIMLQALRCGAFVPGILLWPIGMVLDLHRALEVQLDVNSKESLFIRYFCRSRRWIWLGLMPAHNPRPHGIHLPDDIIRDDILLLPESASCLVPEDRYKEAASMKHQCRLAIRQALLKADNLPDGPKQLALPKTLIHYVDLSID